MDQRDEELESLRDTVRELTFIVKDLRKTNEKRDAQVQQALDARAARMDEQEKQELQVLITVLFTALAVEILLFIILIFKM